MIRERRRHENRMPTPTDTISFGTFIADQLTKGESMIVVHFHLQLPGMSEEGDEIHQGFIGAFDEDADVWFIYVDRER